jgi:hypothetical protein
MIGELGGGQLVAVLAGTSSPPHDVAEIKSSAAKRLRKSVHARPGGTIENSILQMFIDVLILLEG